MRIDIITIFPQMFEPVLNESIIKRAQKKGKVKIVIHNLRDFSTDKHKKVETKGFTDITITDFPIRGRRALLTFRRRYWQIEGEEQYLKRDIQLCFPGTQLEQEFAYFLKEDGGRASGLAGFYRRVAAPPDQRI